jgi:hypothetical protein
MYRVLCDVEAKIHIQLANILSGDGSYPDRLVRILEEIHGSKDSLRAGLSEIVNFETALLKATERGQSRAIDAIIQDIRELRANGTAENVAADGNNNSGSGDCSESRLPQNVQSILKAGFRAKLSIIKHDE